MTTRDVIRKHVSTASDATNDALGSGSGAPTGQKRSGTPMHTLELHQQGETIVFFANPDPAAPSCEFEVHLAPGADGPDPHYHLGQDESFEVVSGVFHATLDGTEHRLVAGERLTIRSGVVHTFHNGLPDQPLVLRGVMEPARNFQWALSEMARSAIRGGGGWKHLSLLDAGWVLHQVRGEYP